MRTVILIKGRLEDTLSIRGSYGTFIAKSFEHYLCFMGYELISDLHKSVIPGI